MKYARIVYTKRKDGLTIGDDMQLLGIDNLYRYMGINLSDVVDIEFEELVTYEGEQVILPISFPLIGYNKKNRISCFSEKITPVFLGVCILASEYNIDDINYFKKYEPIGCRDQYTYENMIRQGINAYINTCMTLALPLSVMKKNNEKKKIYCIDVNGELKKRIPGNLYDDCVFVSHTFNLDELSLTPKEMCIKRLDEYCQNARLVITTRLHGAVPCAAAGIPTIFAKDDFSWRFSGIDKILKVYTKEMYDEIDWNPRPYNFEKIKRIMLENARLRLEGKTDYDKINILHSTFYNDMRKEYSIEFLSNTFKYINKEFDKRKKVEYALWGISQTADAVHDYIKKNYANARLKVVVDSYKKIEFLGIQSTDAIELKKYDKLYVFVCVAAAIRDSEIFFKENGITTYYQCCIDDLNYLEKK